MEGAEDTVFAAVVNINTSVQARKAFIASISVLLRTPRSYAVWVDQHVNEDAPMDYYSGHSFSSTTAKAAILPVLV